jgi:phosphomethylpyrimidine synthase
MEADMTEVIDREGVATVPATVTTGAARRVYVQGSRPDLRVPFREVVQAPTRGVTGDVPNEPLRLYDTSGPHGDPTMSVDPKAGLPGVRTPWILERGDVETVTGTRGNALRARDGAAVTQLHYARRGEITPEMEFVALREGVAPELVRDEIAPAGPSCRPTSTTPSPSRWSSAATSWSRSTPTSATRR